MHRFRDDEVFLKNRKWRQQYISARGRCVQFSTTEFERAMLVSYKCSIVTSPIMHRFRDNVFLQIGNDVMVMPPLGGAVRSFRWQILKGWPQVYIHASLTYFADLQPLKSYSTFSFWLGFPYCRPNLWGFRGKWPPKSQNFEKHLHRGHFLTSNHVFWAIVRGNLFTGMGCTRG